MALYNEILVGRYNRALQKLLSMKGPSPAPQLASDITTGFTFPLGAEFRYLEGWNRFGQNMLAAAVAAQTTNVRLRNPTTSNVIAVVEKLALQQFSVADTPAIQVAPSTTDLAGIFNTALSRFDPRGNPQPSLILSQGNNVASIGGSKAAPNMAVNSNVEVIFSDIQEFTILPGDALNIVTTAVNLTVGVTIWWRERFLEESERF